jgi:hypothetical protein
MSTYSHVLKHIQFYGCSLLQRNADHSGNNQFGGRHFQLRMSVAVGDDHCNMLLNCSSPETWRNESDWHFGFGAAILKSVISHLHLYRPTMCFRIMDLLEIFRLLFWGKTYLETYTKTFSETPEAYRMVFNYSACMDTVSLPQKA